MIHWSCPNCSRSLQFSDQLAGLSRTCPDCGETFVLPETALSAQPQTPLGPPPPRTDPFAPPRPRPSFPGRGGLERYAGMLALAALAVFGVVAFLLYQAYRTDVSIYVDNGDAGPLTVSIDGGEPTIIPPGTFVVVPCRSGDRHVLVKKRGGETVLDQVKHFDKSAKKGVGKYLLNPGETHRYRTYEVEYGMSFQVPNFGFDLPGVGDGDAWVKSKYEEVANKPKLLPPGPWADVGNCHFILVKEPEKIEGFIHETRTVLARVDKKDYAFIQEARRKTEPTAADLDALIEVVNRVLQSTP
jgi:hypothetical protein